jgi:hypothetical protein
MTFRVTHVDERFMDLFPNPNLKVPGCMYIVQVTMINVLMAIGFSVDFSAHICYHFDKQQEKRWKRMNRTTAIASKLTADVGDKEEQQRQIEQILNAIGRPMLEVKCQRGGSCAYFFLTFLRLQHPR